MVAHTQQHEDAPKAPKAPKEPTPAERAQALLDSVVHQHRHNGPITATMVSELTALVNHVTGNKAVVPPHPILDGRGLPYHVLVSHHGTDKITMLETAEQALAYARSLPKDVQARPHWVAAEKALAEAVETVEGSDVSPAIRLFQTAVAEDRKLDLTSAHLASAKAAHG